MIAFIRYWLRVFRVASHKDACVNVFIRRCVYCSRLLIPGRPFPGPCEFCEDQIRRYGYPLV